LQPQSEIRLLIATSGEWLAAAKALISR